MENNILKVKIFNRDVGILYYENDTVFFKYDEEFKKSGLEISPILMPLNDRREYISYKTLNEETYKKLPPIFSDSLPDKYGSTILNAYLQRLGKIIEELTPIEKLSYIGKRGMGALEYLPNYNLINTNDTINITDIFNVAQEVLNYKTNQKIPIDSSLESIIQISSSIGGARAKAIISINNAKKEILPGDLIHESKDITYHILKIDGIKDNGENESKNYGKIEYAYYLMALKSKIKMMSSQLYQENERSHFLTKRFDRINGEKTHAQTLNSIALLDYNNPLINSYEQAFGVLEKLKLTKEEFTEQFRRMVFNVLAMNRDDHTKNISFLMDKKGKWTLSPAYDLTYSYKPNNYWIKQHQMSINGKRTDIKYEDLETIADKYKIGNYKEIIEEVKEGVSQWNKIAKEVGIAKEVIQLIDKNLEYDNLNNNRNFKLRR